MDGLRIGVQLPVAAEIVLFLVPAGLGIQPSFYTKGPWFFPGLSIQGLQHTIHSATTVACVELYLQFPHIFKTWYILSGL